MSGVNIALHPHSTARYIALWQRLYALERAVRVRGDTYAMLGTITQVDPGDPEAGFVGSVFKFTKIDKNSDWIDLRSAKPAPPQVVKEEVRLPDYLQPNLRTFQYYFDVKRHRAIIETKNRQGTFSPLGFETMISRLVSTEEIAREYPGTEVTVEQSREVMKTVLRRGGLKHLKIVLKRPNADGAAEEERKVLEELNKQHASRTVTELHAQAGLSLKPDHRTQLLARVATSNGSVEGTVLDEEGRSVPVSSRDHPHRQPFTVRAGQTARAAFISAAVTFIGRILG